MIELYVPILYSIRREMLRFNHTLGSSIVRFAANFTFDYLWVPAYAMYILGSALSVLPNILLSLFAFVMIYEAGYLFCDNIGIRFEKKGLCNYVYRRPLSVWSVLVAMIIRLLLVAGLFVFLKGIFSTDVIFMFILTFLVFIVHSIMNEKYRIATFLSLRLLKGYVPYAFLLFSLSITDRLLVFMGLLGVSAYYTLEYGARKMGKRSPFDVTEERYSLIRFMIVFLSTGIAVLFEATFAQWILVLLFVVLNNIFFFMMYHLRKLVLGK